MIASLTELRDAIAVRLRSVPGLRVYPEIPDNPTIPAAVITLDNPAITYDLAYGTTGGHVYRLAIVLLVGRSTERVAQRRLDTYLAGDDALKAIVEADRTLGGLVYDVRLTEARNIAPVMLGDAQYLSAELSVEIRA